MVLQAPVFLGEFAPIGPLKWVVQLALVARVMAATACDGVGLSQFAPRVSYIEMLRAGQSYVEVWKRIRREIAFAFAAIATAIFCMIRVFWTGWQSRYMYI